MTRIGTVIALLALFPLGSVARAQEIDTTLWARLRYRFVGPEGNRAVAVVGEPGNSLVAYVGAASGGVWKTEDGGVHWQAVFDSEPAQAIGALALAPSAHNVVWAGTGGTFFIRSMAALGNGVYRSPDAGRSWQHMGLDSTGRIARIVIHPTNPDIVLVCALGRAYGPQQQRGVYRTTDGGRTWTRVLFVDPNTGCADLAIDPGDPNTLFAGMWQFEVKTWHLHRPTRPRPLHGRARRRREHHAEPRPDVHAHRAANRPDVSRPRGHARALLRVWQPPGRQLVPDAEPWSGRSQLGGRVATRGRL